jgi:hypothetical protein
MTTIACVLGGTKAASAVVAMLCCCYGKGPFATAVIREAAPGNRTWRATHDNSCSGTPAAVHGDRRRYRLPAALPAVRGSSDEGLENVPANRGSSAMALWLPARGCQFLKSHGRRFSPSLSRDDGLVIVANGHEPSSIASVPNRRKAPKVGAMGDLLRRRILLLLIAAVAAWSIIIRLLFNGMADLTIATGAGSG